MSAAKCETRAVLAGAYKGQRASLKSLLTHAVWLDDQGNDRGVLCQGVKLYSIADPNAGVDVNSIPTCARCAAKLAKLRAS
jgi:hypothetical protein